MYICLHDETKVRERLVKKMKRLSTFTKVVDTGLTTLTVITRRVSIAAFASGDGLTNSVALSGTGLLFLLATTITRKSFKMFTVKQEKHDAIKLFAQNRLDSIADILSQALKDGDISSNEFFEALQRIKGRKI